MTSIRVLLFAGPREILGRKELTLRLVEPQPTVEQAFCHLKRDHPSLAAWDGVLAFAVNGSYAAPGDFLADGDELALIPPVSGG